MARNGNILGIGPLPEKITDFRAGFAGKSVFLQWSSALLNGWVTFWVQRSANGVNFEDRFPLSTKTGSAASDYAWTDDSPLPGKSFYRLRVAEKATTSYSRVASILNTVDAWKIGKLYSPDGSLWNVGIDAGKAVVVTIRVMDAMGKAVLEKLSAITPP